MEIFIFRQNLIAVLLFLLEQMTNGGAIILSAYTERKEITQWATDGKVCFD